MVTPTKEKITITVPADLLEYAGDEAQRKGVSRSQIISRALAAQRDRDREALAIEGYRFYAAEACEFAASSARAVAEAIYEVSDDER